MKASLFTALAAAVPMIPLTQCYSPTTTNRIHSSRRQALKNIICSPIAIACTIASIPLPFASIANAKEQPVDNDLPLLKESIEALTSLLENWEKATIDCTYADVPRELLEAKNKEKLLEKGGLTLQYYVQIALVFGAST